MVGRENGKLRYLAGFDYRPKREQESHYAQLAVFEGSPLNGRSWQLYCSFDPKICKAEMTYLLVYEHTGIILDRFIPFFEDDLGRERWALPNEAAQLPRPKLLAASACGELNLSTSRKTKRQATTYASACIMNPLGSSALQSPSDDRASV